ncbi:uncharacterized protein LOC105188831 isoform X2 [Harpegnathos saltator]|uniref:uncharacterized protein LOC105188831 isoform X2 n=1 Tax=Harpegnathos saltator TaxID=610380 RepID=UPI00058EC886|nr:uncharacterized protein LOC105188831 isoform X2 [Harpegnathos saltator]
MLVHVGQQPECLLLTMIGMLVYHHRRTQHTVILTSCYWHNIYSGVAELDSEKKVRLLLQTSLTFCDWDENPFEKCFRGLQQLVGSSMISSAFTTSISQRLNQVVTWKVAESEFGSGHHTRHAAYKRMLKLSSLAAEESIGFRYTQKSH